MKYLVLNLSEENIKKCVEGGMVGLTEHQLHPRIADVDGDFSALQSSMDKLMGRGKTPEELLVLSEIAKTDKVITVSDGIIWYGKVGDSFKYEREAANGIYHSRPCEWAMATIEDEESIGKLVSQMQKKSEQLFPLIIESLKDILNEFMERTKQA